MRRLCVLLTCLLALAPLGACASHRPATIITNQGKTAWTADQITVRVGELQKTAMAADAAGGLDRATSRRIVDWTVRSATILKATPDGWQATLTASWLQLKQEIGPQIANPVIASVVAAVDVILGGI